eukprot:4391328-Prymnesium_polylepis.1
MKADHPAEGLRVKVAARDRSVQRQRVRAQRAAAQHGAEGRPPRQRATGSASDTHPHDRFRGAVPSPRCAPARA